MEKQGLGIAVCGAIVGVMAGAGSVLYADDFPLTAQLQDMIKPTETFQRANVERVFRGRTRVPDFRSAAPVDPAAPMEGAPLGCGARMQILSELRPKILRSITNNELVFNTVDEIFSQYVADCQEEKVIEEQVPLPLRPAAVEEEQKPKVNNNCEQYTIGTARHASCTVSERRGERYAP